MNKVEFKNYIYNSDPSHYGNGNEYFQSERSKAIAEARDALALEVQKEKPDLQKFFFTQLEKFEKVRNNVALKTNTKNGGNYGLRRDSEAGMAIGHACDTGLAGRYSEYGDKMLGQLQGMLNKIPHDLNNFDDLKKKVPKVPCYLEESTCFGRKSTFEIEVLDAKELDARKWNVLENPEAEERRNQARANNMLRLCRDKETAKERFKVVKAKDPTLYVQDKMHYFVLGIQNSFPSPINAGCKEYLTQMTDVIFPTKKNPDYTKEKKQRFVDALVNAFPVEGNSEEKKQFLNGTMETCFPTIIGSHLHQNKMEALTLATENEFPSNIKVDYRKSHWVRATSRLEIKNNLVALSQFLTYMNFDGIHDPVERMKGRSFIAIIHHDVFLIEGSLVECSKIFERAVRWDSKSQERSALDNEVGLFRYLYAHTMCDHNGSAAIGEWYQELMYNHHKYTALEIAEDKACDLEALTAPSLGAFIDVNREIIRVEELQKDLG